MAGVKPRISLINGWWEVSFLSPSILAHHESYEHWLAAFKMVTDLNDKLVASKLPAIQRTQGL